MAEPLVEQIEQLGLVPVVVMEDPERAVPLAEALIQGGLPCAEITFRTAAAARVLERLSRDVPQLLLGAGTVLSPAQVQEAQKAGARFVVSPGFDPEVVEFCGKKKIPIFPGVCTPTEVQAALRQGLSVLKFFPAEALGGVAFLRALAAPFRQVRFIPTGGIDSQNLGAYLGVPAVLACGGSWMVTSRLIEQGNFQEIRRRVAEAVALVQEIRRTPG